MSTDTTTGGFIISQEFGYNKFGKQMARDTQWWPKMVERVTDLCTNAYELGFKKGKEESKMDAAIDKLPVLDEKRPQEITDLNQAIEDFINQDFGELERIDIAKGIRGIALGHAEAELKKVYNLSDKEYAGLRLKIGQLASEGMGGLILTPEHIPLKVDSTNEEFIGESVKPGYNYKVGIDPTYEVRFTKFREYFLQLMDKWIVGHGKNPMTDEAFKDLIGVAEKIYNDLRITPPETNFQKLKRKRAEVKAAEEYIDKNFYGGDKDSKKEDNWIHRADNMKCATCMFFVEKHKGEAWRKFHKIEDDVLFGRCRHRSPTPKGLPAVFGNDWCGDHKLDENKL